MAHAPEEPLSPPESPKSGAADPVHPTSPNLEAIYGPLPLSAYIEETRFFTLEPGDWNEIIKCSLEVLALSETPEYHALSYAWRETGGSTEDSSKKETILLNEHEFEISANLASALRFFRASHAGELFWADAICHNQEDKEEMNIQVGCMREIYRKCHELHIWLGNEGVLLHPDSSTPSPNGATVEWTSTHKMVNGESVYVPSLADNNRVKVYNQKFRKFMGLPTAFQVFSKQDFREGAFCLLHILARDDHLKFDEDHPDLQFIQSLQTRDGVFEALREILSRCWWTRQWVVQETVLANDVFVHYGGFTLPWAMLSSAQKTIQVHQSRGCCTTEYAKLRTTDLNTLDRFTHTISAIERWRTIWKDDASAARIQLLPLLWQFRSREAGRRADKLYALLPLVRDWQAAKHVSPHYEWKDDVIFTDSVSTLINVHKSLLPLMGTTAKSPEMAKCLPSWAPDWSTAPPADELARLDRTLLYNAAGKVKDDKGNDIPSGPGTYKLRFTTEEKNVSIIGAGTPRRGRFIDARGLLHDKIAAVGSAMPLDDSSAIARTFQEWFDMALKTQIGDYIGASEYCNGEETRVEAYVRTICMDTEYIGEFNDDENLPLDRHDYQRTLHNYAAPLVNMINQLQQLEDDDKFLLDDADGIKSLAKNSTWKEPSALKSKQVGFPQPGALKKRTSTSMSNHEQDKLKAINRSVKTATSERVFFITEKGLMGLGPKHLQQGDEIAILAGGHTPFILRKSKEMFIDKRRGTRQCHTLIGDCYVHGLMYGEAVEGIKSRDELQQVFLE